MKKIIVPIRLFNTNGDRIRAMTDEELSRFFCDHTDCDHCPGTELCVWGGGKANGLLKWLKQPTEVE